MMKKSSIASTVSLLAVGIAVPVAAGFVLNRFLLTQSDRSGLSLWSWSIPAFLVSSILAALRPNGWLAVGVVPISMCVGLYIAWIPGWQRDPTSNNLWGMVILFLWGVGIVAAVTGVGTTVLIRKWHLRQNPPPTIE